MYKVFFNPETLEIKGHSDGPITMDFPYVETDTNIIIFNNYFIKNNKDTFELVIKNEFFTDEEWNELINK